MDIYNYINCINHVVSYAFNSNICLKGANNKIGMCLNFEYFSASDKSHDKKTYAAIQTMLYS